VEFGHGGVCGGKGEFAGVKGWFVGVRGCWGVAQKEGRTGNVWGLMCEERVKEATVLRSAAGGRAQRARAACWGQIRLCNRRRGGAVSCKLRVCRTESRRARSASRKKAWNAT
jgi:hypothetical protein